MKPKHHRYEKTGDFLATKQKNQKLLSSNVKKLKIYFLTTVKGTNRERSKCL